MNEKSNFLVNELIRFGPFITVLLATLACLESIREFLSGQVTFPTVVERYFMAFLISMLAVRLFTKLLLSYAVGGSSYFAKEAKNSKSKKKG